MPSSRSDISTAVFFDPVTRSLPKIYLDTKHLNDQIYIHLRELIKSGGGSITPYQESASIWIVDPEAPNSLGDPPRGTTVLYAPWVIACSKKGSFLGPEQGNWCGFKVPLKESSPPPLSYPELEPTPAPRPKSFPVRNPVPLPSEQPTYHSQTTELNVGKWSSAETSEAFKYPNIVPVVPIWSLDLTGCPNPPPSHSLDPPNSAGKRTYSDKELTWIVDMIQWCLNKYPDMPLNSVCEVLARKGLHRTPEGYTSRIRRHLQWFMERSPLLAERLDDFNDTITLALTDNSNSEGSPSVAPSVTPKTTTEAPRDHHMLGKGFNTDPKSTRFSDADRAAFIRFAAARPNGVEPIGIERAGDVWSQIARMYPHHSAASWRTWHQHWQNDLKQEVEEYRRESFN